VNTDKYRVSQDMMEKLIDHIKIMDESSSNEYSGYYTDAIMLIEEAGSLLEFPYYD